MRFKHRTYLFGDFRIATATCGSSLYGHTLGGPHDREGASREDCNGILIHLLYRFDLSDPTIPFTLPGVRWLPLYYCFDYRANELGYRLISEDNLITYFPENDPNVTDHEEWPEANFPPEFPRFEVRVEPFEYDPAKLDDAIPWTGIFGIGKLSRSDQEAVRKRVANEMDALGFDPPETEEEWQEALSNNPFRQGKPATRCLNPECEGHKETGRLSTIALMPAEPVAGVHTFGKYGSGTELIFQMCNRCHTIVVSNQCD